MMYVNLLIVLGVSCIKPVPPDVPVDLLSVSFILFQLQIKGNYYTRFADNCLDYNGYLNVLDHN